MPNLINPAKYQNTQSEAKKLKATRRAEKGVERKDAEDNDVHGPTQTFKRRIVGSQIDFSPDHDANQVDRHCEHENRYHRQEPAFQSGLRE